MNDDWKAAFIATILVCELVLIYGKHVVTAVPVNCSAIEQAWVNWYQEFAANGKHPPDRRKLAEKLGCDAYQLAGDFSWLSRVEPDWVPESDAVLFEALKTRQRTWHGKRATGLLCPCSDPLSNEQFSENGIKVMLLTALNNEGGLEEQKKMSKPLFDLVSANPDSVIMVGNSAKLELLGNDTGRWIDSHATVMRFNTNFREDLVRLAGSKRDVWSTGDYRSACGCQGPNCCTPEQLTALWERVGPNVKVYNGVTPGGHEHLHDVVFTHWWSGPFLWNYFLWLRTHEHPHIQTGFPYTAPTRTGMTGLFAFLVHGIVPKMVGFDTGGCMHVDYYELLHRREDFAAHKVASAQPGKPIMHYRHEPLILSELDKAGLLRLVEPKVTEDCSDGIALGVHKEPAPAPTSGAPVDSPTAPDASPDTANRGENAA